MIMEPKKIAFSLFISVKRNPENKTIMTAVAKIENNTKISMQKKKKFHCDLTKPINCSSKENIRLIK